MNKILVNQNKQYFYNDFKQPLGQNACFPDPKCPCILYWKLFDKNLVHEYRT